MIFLLVLFTYIAQPSLNASSQPLTVTVVRTQSSLSVEPIPPTPNIIVPGV
jgi:hypothetical protein